MRSGSFSTMGTAFPRVPPRNDLWPLVRERVTGGQKFTFHLNNVDESQTDIRLEYYSILRIYVGLSFNPLIFLTV